MMGYQESLIYLRPQWRLDGVLSDYLAAHKQSPDKMFPTDICALLTTLTPIPELHCPSGATLIWVMGDRSYDMLSTAMPDTWKLPIAALMQQYPAECIMDRLDPTFLSGVQQGRLTYNHCFRYTPLTDYNTQHLAAKNAARFDSGAVPATNRRKEMER